MPALKHASAVVAEGKASGIVELLALPVRSHISSGRMSRRTVIDDEMHLDEYDARHGRQAPQVPPHRFPSLSPGTVAPYCVV